MPYASDDPNFPGIIYRRGASGRLTPVLRGSSIRVQTIVSDLACGLMPAEIADEYDLQPAQVSEAQVFYEAHRPEIDASIQAERALELKATK